MRFRFAVPVLLVFAALGVTACGGDSADDSATVAGSDYQTAGSAATQLTSAATDETAPSVSRDGKHIAYVSDESGQLALYRMPVGGGRAGPGYPCTELVGWI
jgi:hypothetical protein